MLIGEDPIRFEAPLKQVITPNACRQTEGFPVSTLILAQMSFSSVKIVNKRSAMVLGSICAGAHNSDSIQQAFTMSVSEFQFSQLSLF